MKLMEIFPIAAQHQNELDEYPLHIAISLLGLPIHHQIVMVTLIELCPKAVATKLPDDSYTLHMACSKHYPLAVIRKLI